MCCNTKLLKDGAGICALVHQGTKVQEAWVSYKQVTTVNYKEVGQIIVREEFEGVLKGKPRRP